MARIIWKGAISFSLVHIPVSLHTATRANELDLDLLDRRDFSPVGYQRINKSTGKAVEWADIVKGYEYKKGEYVALTDEDFRRANVKATQTIAIQSFVRPQEKRSVTFDVAASLAETLDLLANSSELTPNHGIRREIVPPLERSRIRLLLRGTAPDFSTASSVLRRSASRSPQRGRRLPNSIRYSSHWDARSWRRCSPRSSFLPPARRSPAARNCVLRCFPVSDLQRDPAP